MGVTPLDSFVFTPSKSPRGGQSSPRSKGSGSPRSKGSGSPRSVFRSRKTVSFDDLISHSSQRERSTSDPTTPAGAGGLPGFPAGSGNGGLYDEPPRSPERSPEVEHTQLCEEEDEEGLEFIPGVLIERDTEGFCGSLLAYAGRKMSAEKLNALSYANLAAGMGGIGNMWLKCTMMLVWVSTSEKHFSEFKYVGTWFVVLATLSFLACQLMFLNLGLAKHESITIIPIYSGLLLVNIMLVGGIYFNEFDGLDTLGSISFTVGMIITVAGLFVVTSREKIVLPDPLGTSEDAIEFMALDLGTPGHGQIMTEMQEIPADCVPIHGI
jgi:hypothetical protein